MLADIYVDGSHIKGTSCLGYGAWGTVDKGEFVLSGTEKNPDFKLFKKKFPDAKFSNPTMELFGLYATLKKFNGVKNCRIVVHQDYNGILNYGRLWDHSSGEQRASKPWKAGVPYIKYIVNLIENEIDSIKENGGSVKLLWVPGHSKQNSEEAHGNKKADEYAKLREEVFLSPHVVKHND